MMRLFFLLLTATLLIGVPSSWAKDPQVIAPQVIAPQRIISLAPSITETLYALGAGERVVGVTDFCDYPADAATKTRVGGFVNTSYEAIVALRPDLVIMLDIDQEEMKANVEALGIDVVMVANESAHDVIESINTIGAAIGAEEKARLLVDDIHGTIEEIKKLTANRTPKKVLVVVSRDYQTTAETGVYVAAPSSYFGDLLTIVGAQNVYRAGISQVKYPRLQGESFYWLKADYLIDIIPPVLLAGRSHETIKKQWDPLVRRGFIDASRITIISADHATRPGPRIGQTLRAIAQIIYPD